LLHYNVSHPANEVVSYLDMDFHGFLFKKSPYMGYPSDEIDAKWEGLDQCKC
jgi:hypothetical protein